MQYAHARIASLLRNAAELGHRARPTTFDPALLDHEREGDLLRALGEFPRVVATAAELREPHRVARYLEELAGAYHQFYDACRVLPHGRRGPADRRCTGPGCGCATRPGRCSRTAWACSASPRPERM